MTTPQVTWLKDYQPPSYHVDHIDLGFELGEDVTTVKASSRFRRNEKRQQPSSNLVLDGIGLALKSIKLDDQELPQDRYETGAESLTVFDVPAEFRLEIVTEIKPQENTTLEGLYKSGGMFCTQCEAEGFRRITYFPDRPDVMAFYTTTIIADKHKYPVLLSNGNHVDAGEWDDGRHWAKWHDPFRKPSYLFALVAGDLVHQEDTFVTRSGREVLLQIFVEKPNIDKCDHAMTSLKKAMKWDEDVFGLEYDLNNYMIVAVNDFNMGAMENKGLNIFNSACILAKPETATDADYESIEAIIAHEYFHNWTGNRVTCRDWFQLSLKEGLTVFRDEEFSADMISRPVKRIADVNILRTAQFPQDAGPMAHPVRPESFVDISNFYTVTVYNKGAEVVRMIHTLVGGREGFRKGLELYFKRHDGQAVTTDDFAQAMADANGIDFTQFKRWYNQAGTPVLQVSRHYDSAKKEYELRIQQSCPSTPGQPEKLPFHIPVAFALLDSEGREIPLHISNDSVSQTDTGCLLHIREAEHVYRFENVDSEPLPSVLRHFSAPVKVELDFNDDELIFLMAHETDDFNRWEAGQRLATRIINRLIECAKSGSRMDVPHGLVNAFRALLQNESLDKSLLSQALSLPNEIYLAEMQNVIDPAAIHVAREHIAHALAGALKDEFLYVYRTNETGGPYRFDADAIGARSLKNLALGYLIRLNTDDVRDLTITQFEKANNMTDVLAAVNALANTECDERTTVLNRFYENWKHDPLVVDKWFAIQSRADLPDAVEQVTRLAEHSAFEIKNPNKVRAVVGGFAFGNPVHFHNAGGKGYEFVADKILQLAVINPQMSARLANAFSQWRRYDEHRQNLMHAQLERIESEPELPRDVYEIVARTLGKL